MKRTKKSWLPILGLLAGILFLTPMLASAVGMPASYAQLSSSQKQLADRIMNSEFLYDCCDQTIAQCLRSQTRDCTLASRLADHVCRLVRQGERESEIRLSLSRRAQTMYGESRASEMNLSSSLVVGSSHAPVTFVVYLCLRCPYCRVIIPQLHQCITHGALRGKVNMVIRPFPIKSHAYSVEGSKAYLAAKEQNMGMEYLLHAYANFNSVQSPEDYIRFARELGLNMDAFMNVYQARQTHNVLVDAKREGLYIDVNATPTFFINGRPYLAETNIPTMRDIAGEEIERINR